MQKNKSVILQDPLRDTVKFVSLKPGQSLATKIPFQLYTDHVLTSYDIVYSSFEVNTLNRVLPGATLRPVTYVVGFTLEDVQEVAFKLANVTNAIVMSYYKHPDREEYALPWSEKVNNTLIPEPTRDSFAEYYAEKESEGQVKTRTEMLADGWL